MIWFLVRFSPLQKCLFNTWALLSLFLTISVRWIAFCKPLANPTQLVEMANLDRRGRFFYFHTWVQPGNFDPAWNLAILQVWPQSGMIFDLITTHPPTHQTTQPLNLPPPLDQKSWVWLWNLNLVPGSFLDVWKVFGRYKKYVLKVYERCLERG